MDLIAAVEAFLVSFVLIAPFVAFLRPRLISLAAGATLVALGALVLEFVIQSRLSPLYAEAVVLVLIAPPVEELLKFIVSGFTGANYGSAAGAGIGFAATENALYFLAAWGEPTGALAAFVAVRAITDPLVHTTATTLTTTSWHGRTWGLPAGLALHMLWNTAALAEIFVDPTAGFALVGGMTGAIFAILYVLRHSESIGGILSDSYRMNGWTGRILAVSGA